MTASNLCGMSLLGFQSLSDVKEWNAKRCQVLKSESRSLTNLRCQFSRHLMLKLKKLNLGVQFEIEASPDSLIDPSDPAVKAMAEAAKQLGLIFQTEEKD